jgi:hypothetical protein
MVLQAIENPQSLFLLFVILVWSLTLKRMIQENKQGIYNHSA